MKQFGESMNEDGHIPTLDPTFYPTMQMNDYIHSRVSQ